ncbi:MAG: mucoidy inhibitor MuiA family protein [Microscillaceae bacterium]|nr:mucoidy inhibitor MuiA family protein [Microscillaceae bacterium]
MKNPLFVILFLLSTYSQSWAQSDKLVQSDIKEVTVFLNRAQVVNVAKVALASGITNLIFEGLSTKIDKQSIQVSAKGNLTIMSVRHQINYLKNQAKAQKIKNLEDSLDFYTEKWSYADAQKKVLNNENELILANKSIGGDGVGVSAQKLKEVSDFYRTRLLEIQNTLLGLEKSIKNYNQRLTRLRQQIEEANRDANKPTSEVVVSVKAENALSTEFELNYIVVDAGWQPIYDLRAKDTQSPVQLSYKANVFQNTGVAWDNVKITLSTGNPTQSGVKPELSTWYVNFYNPYVQREVVKNRGRFDNAKKSADRGAPASISTTDADVEDEEVARTIADLTTVSESAFATTFEISIPYSIPSDGKPQLVDIKNYDLKTKYAYSVVPKMDYDVFLLAKITGWEDLGLLSGKTNIYFEGTFVGESYLDAQNVKDTLAVSLGRDKKIVVKRIKIQDLSSKKSIGTNIKEELGFEINVRNTKKEAVNLTIEEQYPIAKDSQIEVELVEAQNAEINPISGKITWRITLNPAETKKLTLRYSLKYPKNKTITFE